MAARLVERTGQDLTLMFRECCEVNIINLRVCQPDSCSGDYVRNWVSLYVSFWAAVVNESAV